MPCWFRYLLWSQRASHQNNQENGACRVSGEFGTKPEFFHGNGARPGEFVVDNHVHITPPAPGNNQHRDSFLKNACHKISKYRARSNYYQGRAQELERKMTELKLQITALSSDLEKLKLQNTALRSDLDEQRERVAFLEEDADWDDVF